MSQGRKSLFGKSVIKHDFQYQLLVFNIKYNKGVEGVA